MLRRLGSICTSAALACGSLLSVSTSTAQAADNNYARLLQYSLYFYDANMCGTDVQSKTGMEWRGNCHTDDAVPGGFHDAGDHAMFGLPQGYTATALGLGYYEFKDAYDATGQGDHLKVILDHFCTFFKKSTQLSGDSVSKFLYQKGKGKTDHDYWGAPEKQGSRSDQMYWTSNGASDIAANYASALALNYVNFHNAEDLKYAKALYKFSKQYNQCATDGPSGFYDSKVCADEQAMAAGCLALATGEEEYKNAVKAINSLEVHWAYGWNDANLGAAVMNGIVNQDWSAAKGFLTGKCSGSNYLFMDKWGSARLNCSMQFMALVVTKEKQGNYTDWAKGQMNYILGANPANTCFVTGYASNSAKNAHHRGASGYSSYGEFPSGEFDMNDHMKVFSQYGANAKPLIGALVGGPCDAGGSYHDNMSDYVCNEVAIDYNAGLVGAAAGLYQLTNSTSKPNTSINGVKKIYSASSQPDQPKQTDAPAQTTAPSQGTDPSVSDGDIVLMPIDMNVGTEKGDDGKINNFAEFAPQGAKSATLYLTVKSNDTEVSGGFGTWTGKWEQKDFEGVKVGSDKKVTIDYTIPSNVGSTVKAMVFWPHGDDVTIDQIVLHKDGSTTPAVTTKAPAVTTKAPAVTTKAPAATTPAPTVTTIAKPAETKAPLTATLWGDLDLSNDVDISDAVLAARYAVGDRVNVKDQGIANGDVTHDGSVTNDDALKIVRYCAGFLRLTDLANK